MSVGLITTKLVAPPQPEPMVARPRLQRRIAELTDRARVTCISATAGAGKTTAVVEAAPHIGRPLAWLTVDDSDAAPGRLLIYLQAALSSVAPAVATVATDALREGAPQAEAAGLLADAMRDVGVLLVLDELDRLAPAPEALTVVNALLRHAPPAMRVICISRTDLELDLGSTDRLSQLAVLGERELAFTVEEAAIALRGLGDRDADPAVAVEATGGWVTGVLFEARGPAGAGVERGDADPLHAYLGSQILGRLSADQRDLLTTTSVLDVVSAEAAAALGVSGAAEIMHRLRQQRLPGSWSPDGSTFRAHIRFREFLHACLLRRNESDVQRIRVAHGELLAAAGRFEEATEAFLAARALAAAADAARRAIFTVIERGDTDVGERWIRLLGAATVGRSRELVAAELMIANAREDFVRAQAAADQLVAGYRASGEQIPGKVFGLIAWCYFLSGRFEDENEARMLAAPSPEASLVSYTNALEVAAPHVRIAELPDRFGCALDDMILRRVQLDHGRLREALAPAQAPWWRFMNAPWYVEALLVSGRLSEALSVYDDLKARGVEGGYLDGCVAPALLLAAGRTEDAMAALVKGRELVIRSGSSVYHIAHLLVETQLALRIKRDTTIARATLARARELRGADVWVQARCGILLWDGMRLLLDDRDEAARESLTRAVALARSRERLPLLVPAAVYHAEAAWRCGDEAAADDATELALSTSRRMGSNQLLLQALRDFPAVAARRLDAKREVDTEWHAIARLLTEEARPRGATEGLVRVHDLGELRVEIGEQVVAARLRKSLELLAFLASRPHGRATREELLDALFDGRVDDSAGAYLRQAITRLRHVIPDDVLTRESEGALVLTPGAVISEASRLETRISDARRLGAPERRRALADALTEVATSRYLLDVDAEWAAVRREHLDATVLQAHLDIAQLAFDAGDYAEAERRGAQVVAADPYRESAWRLLMRVRSILGDDDGVIATFRSCVGALETVGIGPADATRDLLVTLRR